MALSSISDEVLPAGAVIVRLLAEPTFDRDVCITIRGREDGAVELVVPTPGFRTYLMDQRRSPRSGPSTLSIELDIAEAVAPADAYAAFRKALAGLPRSELVDVRETARDGMMVYAELRDDDGHIRFAAWGTSRAHSPVQHGFIRAVLDLVIASFAPA